MRRALLVAAVVLILAGGYVTTEKVIVPFVNERKYRPIVEAAGLRHGIEAALLLAIVAKESSWRPAAVSKDGQDIGLAGVRIGTARLFLKKYRPDLFGAFSANPAAWLKVPENNIETAALVVRELLDHGIRAPELYHAYNVGEPAYRKGTRSPYFAQFAALYDQYTGRG